MPVTEQDAVSREVLMPRVVYIASNGRQSEISVPTGTSLMRAAVDIGLDGIVGICGGNMSCATCHVYVDERFRHLLPEAGPSEDQALDYTAAERRENSRLSCQIVMNEALDGIVVHMADPQK
jgi:ferredoxin, 2Fe-2S